MHEIRNRRGAHVRARQRLLHIGVTRQHEHAAAAMIRIEELHLPVDRIGVADEFPREGIEPTRRPRERGAHEAPRPKKQRSSTMRPVEKPIAESRR